MRYKVFSPNFARIEELGARGLSLDHVKDAFRFGNIDSFATHGNYITAVQSLSFNDKGEDDNPEDSTYKCVSSILLVSRRTSFISTNSCCVGSGTQPARTNMAGRGRA